jgi:hypothetical protein
MSGELRLCAHCRVAPATTNDHIPPRCFFPKPFTGTLVTVPSCPGCNLGASKDDDYLLTMLILRHDNGRTVIPSEQRTRVMRGLKRKESRGFLRAVGRSMRTVELRSPAGLILGNAGGYEVKVERCHRVAQRIVRGLFFVEQGKPLSADHDVTALHVDHIRGAPPEVSELARAAASNGWKKIGGEVFGYATAKAHGEGWSSVWLLSFYGRVEFLCFIAPRVRVLVPCSECPPDSAN